MAEYLAFAKDHAILVGAAVALIVIIIISEVRRARRPWHDAEPAVAVRLMNAGAQLIDLRGHDAYRSGHIVNARHLPLDELDAKAGKLDKATPVIVYCDSGVTSARAAEQLVKQGFADVWQLRGGLAAWKRDNMPVARS
ncbi:MAG: rhodanese-like domain-containing protein [Proteobacteria bacterium]|nr:rhodanese-like domain-containing protein [Pseudomonadota bacterium]